MKNNMITLEFNGTTIGVKENEMINMTNLWKSVGSPENREPWNWSRFEGKEFIEAVTKELNLSITQVLTSTRGRTGGTYAHKQIALAYAKYLSPELHMYVNQVFFERLEEEANPELGISRSLKRACDKWKKEGRPPEYIEGRVKATTKLTADRLSKTSAM